MSVHLTTERMRIPQNGRMNSSDINKFVDSTIADLQNTVNQVNVNESSTLDVLNTAIREISNLKKYFWHISSCYWFFSRNIFYVI